MDNWKQANFKFLALFVITFKLSTMGLINVTATLTSDTI